MALPNDLNAAVSKLKTKSGSTLITNADALELLNIMQQLYAAIPNSQITISPGTPVGFTPDVGIRVTVNGVTYVAEGQTIG